MTCSSCKVMYDKMGPGGRYVPCVATGTCPLEPRGMNAPILDNKEVYAALEWWKWAQVYGFEAVPAEHRDLVYEVHATYNKYEKMKRQQDAA